MNLVILLGAITAALAQAPDTDRTRLRLTASTETVALPFTTFANLPLHPGGMVALTLFQRGGTRLDHRVYGAVGATVHHPGEFALTVQPEWQGSLWLHRHLGLHTLFGLGYRHAFSTVQTWVKTDDGEFVARPHLGRPQVTTALGVGLEVPVSDRVAIVGQYRGVVDFPTMLRLGVPFTPHTVLHLGIETRI